MQVLLAYCDVIVLLHQALNQSFVEPELIKELVTRVFPRLSPSACFTMASFH